MLEQLERLTARGQLTKLDREHWSLPRATANAAKGTRENLAAGRLDLHRDGYGFVRPNARQAVGTEDIFIPPDQINGAMQGDQVLVEVEPPKSDGRRFGRIVRVVERRNATVVGIFHYARSDRALGHSVTPFDERMTQQILIPDGLEVLISLRRIGCWEGKRWLQVMTISKAWSSMWRLPVGHVDAPSRGSRDRSSRRSGWLWRGCRVMIRKHQLPHTFPENVLAEARSVAHLDLEKVASPPRLSFVAHCYHRRRNGAGF